VVRDGYLFHSHPCLSLMSRAPNSKYPRKRMCRHYAKEVCSTNRKSEEIRYYAFRVKGQVVARQHLSYVRGTFVKKTSAQ